MCRVNCALDVRHRAPRDRSKGFTLIELLVVVVVIGILAAIAIPVYLDAQDNAKDSVARSALTDAKNAVVGYRTDKQALPAVIDAATLGYYGYSNTVVDWSPSPPSAASTSFCLVVASSTGNRFYATDLLGVSTANASPAGC